MSVEKITYLYCDGDNCPRNDEPFLSDPEDDAWGQRLEARKLGWTYHRDKDYCPACQF